MRADSKSPAKRRTLPVSLPETRGLEYYEDRLDGKLYLRERDFMARCPAHPDGRPSLHVWEDDRGLRVHCFAGCSWSEVDAALDGAPVRPARKPKSFEPVERRLVTRYDYRNREGELVFQKLRFEPKDFSFRRPIVVAARTYGPVRHDELILWRSGLKDRDGNFVVEPVPYNLPELLASPLVYIVDGEKDADRIRDAGFVATCSPYGMAHWKPEWSGLLADKSVIVVADRDEPGYRAAHAAVASLDAAADVRLVEARRGKDVSDHMDAGYGLDKLREVA